ncbi:SNF1-related protein kinase regulatory subunit beta-2-like [Apium graveolens]|uniref:SNF1-related protein kinase regulatory subunit beta-2-like n=1 Tax=Apium graveolens TaxID=4045 RepID=UPI003D79FFEE
MNKGLFKRDKVVSPVLTSDEEDKEYMEHAHSDFDPIVEYTVSTIIIWLYNGHEVGIEGSWDNWKKKEYLQRSKEDMMIMKVLPIGVYFYRFIIDGQIMCALDLPQERDDEGNLCNILDLQRHVLEKESNMHESESSPSYNNEYFSEEDYKQKVPELPPFLKITPLNNPPSSSDDHLKPWSSSDDHLKPLPCVLNHLFMLKLPTSPMELGSTQRFRKNYVTIYKSL